jgi:MYXO-CTERM domain-containing protein
MKKTLSLALFVSALASGAGMSAIVVPSYLDSASSSDSFSSSTPTQLVNGSGLSAAVGNGDTLAHALTVTHLYDSHYGESWVTNDHSNSDYFAAVSTNPTIVFDLGADYEISDLVIWQYQNSGNSPATTGNAAYTIGVRYNTETDGTDFSSTPVAETLTVKNVPYDLGGTNSAQRFGVAGAPTARYIQFEVTDNYRGIGSVTGGGDRVGLGEVRVNVVPEVTSVSLLGLGALLGLGLLRRRR